MQGDCLVAGLALVGSVYYDVNVYNSRIFL